MEIKSKSGRHFDTPSDEEEAVINAGILADPNTYELTESERTGLRRVIYGDKRASYYTLIT